MFELRSGKPRRSDIADRYTGSVTLSSGWFFLIGGAAGAVRVAIAKRFFESDFANHEFVITGSRLLGHMPFPLECVLKCPGESTL
jgi:hypothetical protein